LSNEPTLLENRASLPKNRVTATTYELPSSENRQTPSIYEPAANFSRPIKGCSPLTANYTDLSTSANGNINSWYWSFPGGNPSSSTVQNPTNISYATAGSYSVSLSVTTVNGCRDSIKLPMVEVYPWPTADFCVVPPTAPTTNPVFSFCDMWSKDVSQWTWNFGDNSPTDSTSTDPIHSYAAAATDNDFYQYTICIRVQNQHGCWDTHLPQRRAYS